MMTPEQRTKQMQGVHIEYARLVSKGILPLLAHETRDSCHLWATEELGRLVSTFKALSDFELNALRDTLAGKPPKIHARLRDVLAHTKKDPDSWVDWMMHHAPNFKRYARPDRKYTVEAVPLIEAFRMLKQEEARGGSSSYRKPDWTPMQRGAVKVTTEQALLWGERR